MRQTVKLDAVLDSARTARDVVRSVAGGQPTAPGVLDTALLLTSELVVNAARHGQGEITLDITLSGNRLRVSVTDAGSGEPAPQHGDQQFHEAGRGLALVEELATRWGVEPASPVGKTVWFELAYLTPVE